MAQATAASTDKIDDKKRLESGSKASNQFSLPVPLVCQNPNREWDASVDVSRPDPIGSYFRLSDGSLHQGGIPPIFIPPNLPVDISSGVKDYVKKIDISSTADILKLLDALKFSAHENNARFITFRNNLNKIMSAPYSREDWTVGVRFDPVEDVVLLDMQKGVDKVKARNDYAGRHWERCCTHSLNHLVVDPSKILAPSPTAASASASAVSEESKSATSNYQEEFCVVQKVRIGSHRIVMAAEIDCFQPTKNILAQLPPVTADAPSVDNLPFPVTSEALSALQKIPLSELMQTAVEIKSSGGRRKRHLDVYSVQKFLRYWIQSFLAGVPTIFVGWRDKYSVNDTEFLQTERIPSKVNTHFKKLKYRPDANPSDFEVKWHANVCLNFTERLLGFVWQRVHEKEAASKSSNASATTPAASGRFRHYSLRFVAPYSHITLEKIAQAQE